MDRAEWNMRPSFQLYVMSGKPAVAYFRYHPGVRMERLRKMSKETGTNRDHWRSRITQRVSCGEYKFEDGRIKGRREMERSGERGRGIKEEVREEWRKNVEMDRQQNGCYSVLTASNNWIWIANTSSHHSQKIFCKKAIWPIVRWVRMRPVCPPISNFVEFRPFCSCYVRGDGGEAS